jgi:hypothetical protein
LVAAMPRYERLGLLLLSQNWDVGHLREKSRPRSSAVPMHRTEAGEGTSSVSNQYAIALRVCA